MLHILLDSTPPAAPMEFSWGNIGAAGVCFALVAYIVKVTLPQLVASFREDTRLQREAHAEVMASQQKVFTDELAKERDLSMRREQTWRETLLNLFGNRYATQATIAPPATGNVQNVSAST